MRLSAAVGDDALFQRGQAINSLNSIKLPLKPASLERCD